MLLLSRQLSNLFLAPIQSFKIIKPCALGYLFYSSAENFTAETSKIWISTYSLNICCQYCIIMRGTSPIYRNFDKVFLFIGSRISVFRLYTLHLFLNVRVPLKSDCFGICITCITDLGHCRMCWISYSCAVLCCSFHVNHLLRLFSHMQLG